MYDIVTYILHLLGEMRRKSTGFGGRIYLVDINMVATWERRIFMGLVEGACNTANLYTCRLKWTACRVKV